MPQDALPEMDKEIEVLCSFITRAKLVSVDPEPHWQQTENAVPSIEMKLWRPIDEQQPPAEPVPDQPA